jgi:hypothetical protein
MLVEVFEMIGWLIAGLVGSRVGRALQDTGDAFEAQAKTNAALADQLRATARRMAAEIPDSEFIANGTTRAKMLAQLEKRR